MKNKEKLLQRKTITSIFAIAVFLFSSNIGHSQACVICTVASASGVTSDDGTGDCTTDLTSGGTSIALLVNTTPAPCVIPGDYGATVGPVFVEYSLSGATTLGPIAGIDASSEIYNVGVTTVTYRVVDLFDGQFTECSVTVTITDDEDPSIVTCPSDVTQTADPGVCEAVVDFSGNLATAFDNCGVVITNDYNAGGADASDTYPVGTTTVTFTATDPSSNTNAVLCEVDVTITDDEDPVLTCPTPVTQTADPGVCEAVVDFSANLATATDNCPGVTITNDYNGGGADASDTYPVGTTTVTFTADDGTNTVMCSIDVIITDDEDPVVSCFADITQTADPGICEATVAIVPPLTSDNCPGETLADVRSDGNALGDPYPVGVTTITWTVTDAVGLTDVCVQTITVTDDEDPVITCPLDVTQTADPGVCNAAVDLSGALATATDNCGVTITNDFNGGGADASDTYPVGTTTVTFTATDPSGNTDVCSIDVTITDDEDPVITCPSDVTQTADPGVCEAFVDFSADLASATDNCSVIITNDYNGGGADASDIYPVGTTTVTFTATDPSGNTDVCSIDVTITDDEAPVIICPDVADVNSANNCFNTVAWALPIVTDNCGVVNFVSAVAIDEKGNSIAIINAETAPTAVLPVGVNEVTYTYNDGNGNEDSCTFDVEVVDTEVPSLTCPADPQVQHIASCTMPEEVVPSFIGLASFSDNCDTRITVSQDPMPLTPLSSLPGSPGDGDSYMVTITINDGYTGDVSCSFTVNIIEDDEPNPDVPGAVLPTLTSTCGPLIVDAPMATDLCGNPVCGTPFPVDPSVWNFVGGTCPGALPPSDVIAGTTGPVPPVGTAGTSNFEVDASGLTGIIGTGPGEYQIENVTITELTHTFDGDLDISLISPAGTSMMLSDQNGGAGDNFIGTIFENDGNPCITSSAAAFSGNFEPEGGLSNTLGNGCASDNEFNTVFAGESVSGMWTLRIIDNFGGDSGTMSSWSMEFQENPAIAGPTPQYEFLPGNHTITWIYSDYENGNSSTQQQQINVSNDAIAPTVVCQDITLELDGAGNASFVDDDIIAAVGFDMTLEEDFGNNANNPGTVNMTVTATSDVTFTFDWDYFTADPGFEALSYYVNGAPLPNGNIITSSTATGTTSVPLLNGDVFTIEILTVDNLFGDISTVTIDNFSPGFSGDYSLGNWTFASNGVLNGTLDIIDGEPSDDCSDVADLIISASQTSFTCSDIGDNSVTLSVEDEAGNIGTCIAIVTVVDALAPTLTLVTGDASDMTVDCDEVPAVDEVFVANDNCDGSVPVQFVETSTQTGNPLSCGFYTYVITRTWSATDVSNNTGTFVQTINVEDVEAPTNPTIVDNIPANDTISTDPIGCTASVSLAATDYEDCADFADLTITNNSPFANAGAADASGDYPIGSYNVQFTATDPCGNTSNWFVSFEVVDGVAPVTSCVNDLNIGIPSSGILVLNPNAVDNGSFDECSGVTLTVVPDTFTCADVGNPRMVTLTATDAAGNSSSCTTTVNLQDNNAPTAICQSITVTLDENGMATVDPSQIDNGSFDDCFGVTLSLSQTTFTEADLGDNTVTLTVTDTSPALNQSNCNAIVTVQLPPACFGIGIASGGAGEVVSVPITSDNFTALVGFQLEFELNSPATGDFVGVSDIHPDLTNVLEENLIVTDSFISDIDSMIVIGSMGQDSTVYDTIYTDNHDRMSVSWNQFNTDGMGDLLPITLPDGTILFNLDVFLTGNIGDFSLVTVDPASLSTPPQVVFSYPSGFIPSQPCPGGYNNGAVTIGELIIAGDIFTEDGAGINLVDVDLFQPPNPFPIQVDQTGTDGAYQFTVASSGSFTVAPSKNINWSNGIDILDVAGIQRHSVGNPYVSTAYKKIAADVSGEGFITTFDAVLLNAYLASLFMDPPPPTPSWQFVDARQMLANDPNATVPSFTNTISFTNLMSDTTGNDFVGVKTGDLGVGTIVVADTLLINDPGSADQLSDDVLKFILQDRALTIGDNVSIDVHTDNFDQMIAYQWILEFDNSVLRYNGYDNVNLDNLGDISFGEVLIDEGKLILTWYNGTEVSKSIEDIIYSLNFEVLTSVNSITDLFKVYPDNRMLPKAYRSDETPMDIELVFEQVEDTPSKFELYQNTPNPFKDETTISFILPEASDATMTIMDVTGRVLKQYEGSFSQGYNEISVNRGELPQAGTLIYELKTSEHTATKKMIIID